MKFSLMTTLGGLMVILVAVAAQVSAQQCAPDMEFSECGTACPEHCPVRDAKTGKLSTGLENGCFDVCVSGCFCAKGFVQDLKREKLCVLRAKCTAP